MGYKFITFRDLWHLERSASALDDWATLNDAKTPDGLSGPIRDWFYALRFPSLWFGSHTHGQIFRRYGDNTVRLGQIERARGFPMSV